MGAPCPAVGSASHVRFAGCKAVCCGIHQMPSRTWRGTHTVGCQCDGNATFRRQTCARALCCHWNTNIEGYIVHPSHSSHEEYGVQCPWCPSVQPAVFVSTLGDILWFWCARALIRHPFISPLPLHSLFLNTPTPRPRFISISSPMYPLPFRCLRSPSRPRTSWNCRPTAPVSGSGLRDCPPPIAHS